MRPLPVALLVAALAVPAVAAARRSDPRPFVSAPPVAVAPAGVGDVRHLTPSMRRSVRLAIEAARADGVELRVASGWRSAAHQQRLYEEAVAKYGSPEAARRWVLPPDESAHVRGEAVDVAPPEGAAWLDANGVRFGMCRRYANEPWHFERLAGAKGSACPPPEPHA
jgi:hypothetical protein